MTRYWKQKTLLIAEVRPLPHRFEPLAQTFSLLSAPLFIDAL